MSDINSKGKGGTMLRNKRNIWLAAISILCIGFFIFSTIGPFAAVNNNDDDIEINPPEMIPFKIQVVDSETGRGVPMIQLETTNGARYYTDSNGFVSFYDPGVMDQDVFFLISGHGYVFPKSSMGSVGERVTVRSGETKVFEVDRVNIAERLYRITGQGIYRHSLALGETSPIDKPILNAKVAKQDSAQVIQYNDELYWFWGDTLVTNDTDEKVRVTGAISKLPGKGGLEPDKGVNLEYFTDNGVVKELVPNLPDGAPKVSISSLLTTKKDGKEVLLAGFVSYSSDDKIVSRGLLQFNDSKKEFELVKVFDEDEKVRYPEGKAFLFTDNGKEYWVFCNPYPVMRVENNYNSIINQSQYEAFSPLEKGEAVNTGDFRKNKIERDSKDNIVWGWKKDTAPIAQDQESRLIRLKLITESDKTYYQFKNVETDVAVTLKSASVHWNEYKNCWVMIAQSKQGNKLLGDIYYSEADTPMGPWEKGKVIVSHNDYGFNDPIVHPYFSEDNGRIIYFEGNYSNESHSTKPTAYYDNNQIMYRLNLEDSRLNLNEMPK